MKQIYGLAFIPKTDTGANITTFGASQDNLAPTHCSPLLGGRQWRAGI